MNHYIEDCEKYAEIQEKFRSRVVNIPVRCF